MLVRVAPISRDVRLESLAEDRAELHDVLLEAHDVTIKSEHVVHTLVLEVLNVDCLILGELDQVTHLMVLGNLAHFSVVETHVESVETHGLLLRLEALISERVEVDHIDLAERVTCLQAHVVVEWLSQQDLHLVDFSKLLYSLSDLQVWRKIASVDFAVRADGSLDGPAEMQAES